MARPAVLPLVGLAVGVWSFLPKYTGPATDLAAPRVEFVDHVVPGAVVLVAAAATLIFRLRDTGLMLAGMLVALAGFWMTATHFPLVLQATRGQVAMGSALYHSVPGVVVLATGLFWMFRPAPDGEADRQPPTTA